MSDDKIKRMEEIIVVQDTIRGLISNHLDLLNKVNELSLKCLSDAHAGKVNDVVYTLDNRDRLINVVEKFQKQIEDILNTSNNEIVDEQLSEVVAEWADEITKWVKTTNEVDEQTMVFLQSQREDTTKELATIYKGKVGIKGYNLTSVKK